MTPSIRNDFENRKEKLTASIRNQSRFASARRSIF